MYIRCLASIVVLAASAAAGATPVCNLDEAFTQIAGRVILDTQPQPGFGVSIQGDFDAWYTAAPPLDRNHAGFHEGNAVFWQTNFLKAFVVALTQVSPATKDHIARLLDGSTAPLANTQPMSRLDTFAMRYLTEALKSNQRIMAFAHRARDICAGEVDSASTARVATELTNLARELGTLLYTPLLPWTPNTVLDDPRFFRRALLDSLVSVAKSLESQGTR